jgi:2-polyprenyl-3-methyl-5-hydroxy-6-metoxy-1,4-benzoquinol methylase
VPSRYISGEVVKCSDCGCLYKIPADIHKDILEHYNSTYGAHFIEDDADANAELTEILEFIEVVRAGNHGRLLDLGCGPGRFLRLAKQHGFDVSGVEATASLAKTATAATGGTVVVGDLMLAGFPQRSFDVVTALDLIEHVQDPIAMLEKYRNTLKADGHLVVFTPNHASLIVKVARLIHLASMGAVKGPCDEIFDCLHVTFFDTDRLRDALEKAGFEVTAIRMIPYRPERRRQATGVAAAALKMIERVSPLVPNGPFRTLMAARPISAVGAA